MRYLGNKSKITNQIVPIIQSYINEDTKGYIEPFVGGANVIDKINHKNKIGVDLHEELIELLKYISVQENPLPEFISEEEYNKVKNNKQNFDKWYVGLVGFCASYSAKYFNGYARDFKGDNSGKWSKGAINNIQKQRINLKDIKFFNKSFLEINQDLSGYVIYCDPPYRDTTKYKTEKFPYEDFYNWCKKMSKNNIVLISEYNMPEENFECIWSQEVNVKIDCNNDGKKVTERLFKCK